MSKVLVVVDMQKDFISGSLGTLDAQRIVPIVVQKVKEYYERHDKIVFTRDCHFSDYLSTNEGKYLPIPHCIISTEGRQIADELLFAAKGAIIIDKNTFGNFNWVCIDPEDEIEIVGLCTDICVISNALILRSKYPEKDIIVDASCCAGTTPEMHDAALKIMRSCQIEVVNYDAEHSK